MPVHRNCHPSFASMTGNNDAHKPAAERQYDPDKPNALRLVSIAYKLEQIAVLAAQEGLLRKPAVILGVQMLLVIVAHHVKPPEQPGL